MLRVPPWRREYASINKTNIWQSSILTRMPKLFYSTLLLPEFYLIPSETIAAPSASHRRAFRPNSRLAEKVSHHRTHPGLLLGHVSLHLIHRYSHGACNALGIMPSRLNLKQTGGWAEVTHKHCAILYRKFFHSVWYREGPWNQPPRTRRRNEL